MQGRMGATKDGNRKARISLDSATSSDVLDLVNIQAAAFKFDQLSNLMTLGRDENTHKGILGKTIELWMSDPASQLIKAVDTNGDVVGWSCWVLKGGDGYNLNPESETKLESIHGSRTAAIKLSGKNEENPSEQDLGGNDPRPSGGQSKAKTPMGHQQDTAKDPPRVFGELLRRDIVEWEDKHMKGRKYMVLQALFTDPHCQGQGIGSTLVQWGIEKAETEGIACWLHASPVAYSLYRRAGFKRLESPTMTLMSGHRVGREEIEDGEDIHLGTWYGHRVAIFRE